MKYLDHEIPDTTPEKPEIVIVTADDWEAIYVNGHCLHQNHSIDWDMVMRRLDSDGLINYKRRAHPNEERLMVEGYMPTCLADLDDSVES